MRHDPLLADHLSLILGQWARMVYHESGVPGVTTDTKGLVTYFSPGAEGVYGYASEEVIGHPVAEYYDAGPAEAEKMMTLLKKFERIKNFETILLGRDGRKIYASMSASLLKNRSGGVIGTLGVSKDITQRVELERKLKELTITDSLTGLYNQRYFHRKLAAEMERKGFTFSYDMLGEAALTEADARSYHSLYLPEHTHIPTSRVTPPPTGEDTLAK